jgi:hypothetical protein
MNRALARSLALTGALMVCFLASASGGPNRPVGTCTVTCELIDGSGPGTAYSYGATLTQCCRTTTVCPAGTIGSITWVGGNPLSIESC